AIVSLTVLALAVANHGSAYRYSCNWNTGIYKCTHVRCTHAFDGTTNCTTSVTTPKGTESMRVQTSYRYSCDWNADKYQCTHLRCSHYFDGHKNCTTSVTVTP
ncbi:hypothetical protein KR084_005884, partial [Drosophila pseudotakahashii]